MSDRYQPPAVPLDEETRLHSLRELKLLDTEPEERFDRVVKLAAAIFQVPIAYIALVDRDRQWFKAQTGMCATQTSRDVSFCGHAILQDSALVVPDAKKDPRFAGRQVVVLNYAHAAYKQPQQLM
ncbi:MAG: GAF domain-containing protein, partial [Limisphaerales bacterium]